MVKGLLSTCTLFTSEPVGNFSRYALSQRELAPVLLLPIILCYKKVSKRVYFRQKLLFSAPLQPGLQTLVSRKDSDAEPLILERTKSDLKISSFLVTDSLNR